MDNPLKKIVVVGPESSGKTTLCNTLASRFNGAVVEEYARRHLVQNGKDYRYEDLLTIARGQMNSEESALASAKTKTLFIDSGLLVMKIWSEFVFGDCDVRVLNQLAIRHYDLYLLCRPDLPWEKDELREHPEPNTRNRIYHLYRDFLIHQHIPWVEVAGTGVAREEGAAQKIHAMMHP